MSYTSNERLYREEKKMKITGRYEKETMPYDMAFEIENGRECCHATGYEVTFEGDNTYWNEYVDRYGEYHYGR